jgi:endonuclease/exonuclease/phosphatase family metal-dependent hydrolase
MTLNAWFRPPLADRAAEIASWIEATGPQVVCLQEITQAPGQDTTLADQLAAEVPGGWQVAFRGFPARAGGVAGTAVLSRWPILASDAIPLACGDATPKSVLHARAGELDVFSVHLASAPDAADLREQQVLTVTEFVRSRSADGSPLPPVIAGDFNTTPGSSPVRFLRGEQALGGQAVFYQDAWAAAGDGTPGHTWAGRNPHTPPAHLFDARCDYIFAGLPRVPLSWSGGQDASGAPAGQVTAAWLACDYPRTGIMASDHYAVVADICWPDVPAPD